ncbi:hypothetical protein [Cochlodiniinecator piscidefendens]|uniref:hypothetical protein n=1 Tax=Cochlodiniinecator piscidefendens TaxID=2715756 RepID=UPI00140A50B3|nr:hypothetical protein [Cochlodiniinecator piscidefendens]
MTELKNDDIRAAVAADILDEKQASLLIALIEKRQGARSALPDEDEPFEFFKGFSEIFVTVGLGLLLAGALMLAAITGSGVAIFFTGAVFTWISAAYFTLKRRMSLPSIALAAGFGMFLAGFCFAMLDGQTSVMSLSITGVVGMVAMLAYFRVFKLPFAMLVFGVFGGMTILALAGITDDNIFYGNAGTQLFDLRQGSTLAYGSLLFGILTFCGGMYFDLKDPNRLSRYSATGFWLHILAAPALVNTIALSLFNIDGTTGYVLTAIAMLIVALLALIIDRRSFLTAGIGYIGAILVWAFQTDGETAYGIVSTLLILGLFITVLGAQWVQIRAKIMNKLPNFPYKHRLPPYSESA